LVKIIPKRKKAVHTARVEKGEVRRGKRKRKKREMKSKAMLINIKIRILRFEEMRK
jgi:hypothetical protein